MKFAAGLALGTLAVVGSSEGSRAADIPLKANAVEYVKVCNAYGSGYYYIPGSDTCIKLGGYLRVENSFGTNSVYGWANQTPAGGHNRLANSFTTRSRQELYIETRTATEYGVARTLVAAAFTWTSGSTFSGGTPVGVTGLFGDAIGGGTLALFAAFTQIAGFTIGKAFSRFDVPWSNYPGNSFDGLVGGGGTVTGVHQFSYTADFGGGFSLAVSAQDPTLYTNAGVQNLTGLTAAGMQGGLNGVLNNSGTRAPDLVTAFRIDQAWGLFQASAAAHANSAGYYGATEFSGHPDDKWGWAAQLALSLKNLPTGTGDTINVQAVYTDGATRYNFQSLAPVGFAMYGGTGLAGAYQSIGFANAPDAVYVGTTAANGSRLETITTWGFRGAYTHNWNPNWNSSLYGAYGSVRYGTLGRNTVCAFIAAGQPLVNGCNPDFNIRQIGLITRWIPVKNMAFSGDFTWSNLDQKYAGIWNAPLNGFGAKPATFYELKDQNSLTVSFRVQRNW